MPKLSQVQGFITRCKPTYKTRNLIKCVADFVLLYQFKEANLLDESKPFVFGTTSDNDIPVIGSGSSNDHLHVCMTFIKLLKMLDTTNQNHQACFHIDGTYKITRNKFPVVVLGRTDISRQFLLIVFMLTSHEDETDFTYFYRELLQLLHKLQYNYNILINFNIKYLMQDACLASYKAC